MHSMNAFSADPKIYDDEYWMREALLQAQLARQAGEVPVGAVLVNAKNQLLAVGHNQMITLQDPSAHAEVVVVRAAAQLLKNYRLPNTRLYVTLEPCTMCCGLLVHARIDTVVYGASDPRTGAVLSVNSLLNAQYHNHQVKFTRETLGEASGRLLREFFKEKRNRN